MSTPNTTKSGPQRLQAGAALYATTLATPRNGPHLDRPALPPGRPGAAASTTSEGEPRPHEATEELGHIASTGILRLNRLIAENAITDPAGDAPPTERKP
ncbi:hypothetical protein [Actinoplanes sp. HUAS TT8]|uniref:hypothetical protein n=1 Tax=Actinoplanes sp. HUAS TT8 TaxID=3447453 RepID=UPI003F525B5A